VTEEASAVPSWSLKVPEWVSDTPAWVTMDGLGAPQWVAVRRLSALPAWIFYIYECQFGLYAAIAKRETGCVLARTGIDDEKLLRQFSQELLAREAH
jgi:hypothetical protein